MALGEALMEEQTFRLGLHKFPSLLEYKSPTALEAPVMHSYLVETIDREGPFGAKEAGQGPPPPGLPAGANTRLQAPGGRSAESPRTAHKGLQAAAGQGRRGGGAPDP